MVERSESEAPERLVFGPFVVDIAAEEISRNGIEVRLVGQPFQILRMLLARPGGVVTREQLREHIWSDGTFVDFEHGLNAAMNKLRKALGDEAESPHYVATIPGRGYRFIGLVERLPVSPRTPVAVIPSQPREEEPQKRAFLGSFSRWSMAAAGVLLGAATAGLVAHFRAQPQAASAAVVQFSIASPPGAVFTPPISRQSFAISPDGTRLAFTVTDDRGARIWMRDLSSLEMHPVRGTEGAWSVFWSPDGQSIFCTVLRTLKQINLETNFTRTFPIPMMTNSGAWRSGNDLLLDLGPRQSFEISMGTGSGHTPPTPGLRWAQSLPGTDKLLDIQYETAIGHYRAMTVDFTTRQQTPLMETDSRVLYAPSAHIGDPGYLLFIRGGSLFAQSFNTHKLRLIGEPFAIAQDVVFFSAGGSGSFSASQTGVLVYQSGFPLSELRWYDRQGHIVSASQPAPFSGTVRLSPDGTQAAADVWTPASGSRDIWTFGKGGRESSRLTYPPAIHIRPVWSPDGSRIAFGGSRTSAPRLSFLGTEEGRNEQPFLNSAAAEQLAADQIQIPTDWSRDGKYIAYDTSLGEEERQVWLLDIARKQIVPLLRSGGSQWGAAFSPDGRQIAFISDESGRPEIYLQALEPSPSLHVVGRRTQVSRTGGWLVRWNPDGGELIFLGLDAQLYAASRAGGGVNAPVALFQIPGTPRYGTPTDIQFDVAPGGQRFVVTTAAGASPPDFIVIQNWEKKFHH